MGTVSFLSSVFFFRAIPGSILVPNVSLPNKELVSHLLLQLLLLLLLLLMLLLLLSSLLLLSPMFPISANDVYSVFQLAIAAIDEIIVRSNIARWNVPTSFQFRIFYQFHRNSRQTHMEAECT